jgi:D-glycero-alpha-D-manno-heptose-7-phosphate kinase
VIVTRAPLRLPLGGGGTDLPSYSRRHGGEFLAAAIDKYVYIVVNRPAVLDTIMVKYSLSEEASDPTELKHDLVREALLLHGIERNLEIASLADLPAGTGMGSSGSYTVALLAALRALKGLGWTAMELAEEASTIEIDRAGHPVGKQDQLVASFGGVRWYQIGADGAVVTEPARIPPTTLATLERRLQLWFTGATRDSATVLGEQRRRTERGDRTVLASLHETKRLGQAIRDALVAGDLVRFGGLLDRHWQSKKRRSEEVSNNLVDEVYLLARRHGALGGKLMGAGGGGFLMLLVDEHSTDEVARALSARGLRQMPFRFVDAGVEVLLGS